VVRCGESIVDSRWSVVVRVVTYFKVFAKSSGSRREPLIKRGPDAKSFRHRTRVEIFTAIKPLRPGRILVAPCDEIREMYTAQLMTLHFASRRLSEGFDIPEVCSLESSSAPSEYAVR
jgi:hypothetical protein